MDTRPRRWPDMALSLWERARLEYGRRATALTVALAIELLLLLALLSLGRSTEPPKGQVVEISLEARDVAAEVAEEPMPEEQPPPPTERSTPQPVETAAPVLAPPPAPAALIPLPTAPPAPPPASARPRPVPPAAVDGPAYGPPDTGAPPSDDSVRVGTAPDGSPLYAAKWYREPGREFWGYLSAASSGSGLMACRTIANYYVADCVALGDTPGSMINRSMLAGSGVLMVRPPRLGGRSLVGAWVRIRIDYNVRRN